MKKEKGYYTEKAQRAFQNAKVSGNFVREGLVTAAKNAYANKQVGKDYATLKGARLFVKRR